MSNLVDELRERHAPNCHQFSNEDPDMAAAGDAILDAADRIAALEAALRNLVNEWDGWSAGDEPLGDDRLEVLVEAARKLLPPESTSETSAESDGSLQELRRFVHYIDERLITVERQLETGTEPARGVGQKCHLCHNVHDLMSACPPVVLDAPNSEWRFTEGRECGACGHWIVPGGSSSCSLDHAVPETPVKPEFDPAWVCGVCGKRHGRGECVTPKIKGDQT